MSALTCTAGMCDRPAAVAVHPHSEHTALLRWDHVDAGHAEDLRCEDCAVFELFDPQARAERAAARRWPA